MQATAPMAAVRWGLALAAPLGVLALSYGLWATSDRLGYVGPLDKAQFGWLVLIPVASSVPVAAAFAWERLTGSAALVVPFLVAIMVAVPVAAAFWVAIAHPDCQFGSVMTEADTIRASVIVGVVAGGGYAIAGIVAAVQVRGGHRWRGAFVGLALGFAMLWITAFTAFATVPMGLCERPHP